MVTNPEIIKIKNLPVKNLIGLSDEVFLNMLRTKSSRITMLEPEWRRALEWGGFIAKGDGIALLYKHN